jgi:hypothetical protein
MASLRLVTGEPLGIAPAATWWFLLHMAGAFLFLPPGSFRPFPGFMPSSDTNASTRIHLKGVSFHGRKHGRKHVRKHVPETFSKYFQNIFMPLLPFICKDFEDPSE